MEKEEPGPWPWAGGVLLSFSGDQTWEACAGRGVRGPAVERDSGAWNCCQVRHRQYQGPVLCRLVLQHFSAV